MASLADIRAGLAETIEAAIAELQVYPNVPGTVNLPAVLIVPRSADLAVAFGRGHDVYSFDLVVLTSRRDDDLAQFDLDDYVTGAGAKSIRQAVFETQDIGLEDTEAFVTGMSQYGGTFDIGDVAHLGAVLACQVRTTGTA